ncbi:MAG: synthase subunit F-type H+-transporting ATPase subunit a [Candidatus Parcubacteria bacterium]|jgi:F-type H+-transporting ATPase subunit a
MFSFVHTAHAAGGISVKLSPYIVGHIGGMPITATMLTTWLSMAILVVLAVLVGKNLQSIPGKLQSSFEVIVGGAYNFVETTLENKELAQKYFPVLMTIFLFILAMNWTGLLPGVTSIGFYDESHEAAVTETHGEAGHEEATEAVKPHLTPLFYPPATDLNLAIGFAFVAMIVIEMAGIAALGVFKYGGKFFTFRGHTIGERLLNFLVGLIELISELGRLVSFSFRLFGNIFAGKTLLTVILFFVPLFVPVPILAYEVFVGFIQAGVFAFLTLIFIKLAVVEPHH